MGAVYDWTLEGRSRFFAHTGRYLTVDLAPISRSIVGAEYEVTEDVVVTIAAVHRHGQYGTQAGIRQSDNTRRGSVVYRYTFGDDAHHRIDANAELRIKRYGDNELWLGAIVHEGGDATEVRGSGAALRWRDDELELAVGVEATRTRDGENVLLSIQQRL